MDVYQPWIANVRHVIRKSLKCLEDVETAFGAGFEEFKCHLLIGKLEKRKASVAQIQLTAQLLS